MRLLKKEEDLMIELNPDFQNRLFDKLIEKYGRCYLSKKLSRAESIIYHYRNNRVKAIPKLIVENAIKLSDFSKEDLKKNTRRVFSAEESIKEIMKQGARKSHKQLKERLTIKFGAYSLLEKKKGIFYLNTLNWLNKNSWINSLKMQKGLVRDAKIEKISHKYLKISYLAYNKRTKKCEPYLITFPNQICIYQDFCYFLGLLYGDGLSGARVGIANIDRKLIKWTADFLSNYFWGNKIKAQLNIHQKNSDLDIKELSSWLSSVSKEIEIYNNLNARGYYVFTVFITNKILRRILDDFMENIGKLFLKLNFDQRGAFLAGFFDAEGNVNKLDRNFRFSQKIETKVATIRQILDNEGYHTRYDGSNILIGFKKEYKGDLDLFEKQILPCLKHSKKTKEARELIEGYLVRKEYNPILKIIVENPGISHSQVSAKINRVKCPGKLAALAKAGLVRRERKQVDESFKYYLTDEGLEYLKVN
ncbi:hypothetical protein HZA33_01400 [Candidatus Pacearchaeota archaeon]|nr:hypothetical protein [Candidatus Pacearchaeota archaeon]